MKLRVGSVVLLSGLVSVLSGSPAPGPTEECPVTSVLLRTFKLTVSCNVTTLKPKQLQDIQAPITNLYLPMLYLLAFTVGLPANLLALWVLVFRTKPLPSTILLINLTLADSLLLLVLPFRIVYHLRGNDWELGEASCRVVMAVFYGNMYGSMWCLALVAVDRCLALVCPFRARSLRSRRVSRWMSAMVWVAVLAAMLPLLMSRQTYKLDEPNITTCHDALPEEQHKTYFLPYFSALFACCFLLPFGVVVSCHGAVLHTLLAEGKRYGHAVRVTVLVLSVFVLCFLPSNVLLLLTYAGGGDEDDDVYVPYMVSLAVSAFNSCLDPFIFYFVSTEFRQKLKSALCRPGGCRGRRHALRNTTSSATGQSSKITPLTVSGRQGKCETALLHGGDKVTST